MPTKPLDYKITVTNSAGINLAKTAAVNRIAMDVISQIVRSIDGKTVDTAAALIIAEQVVIGTFLATVKLGGDEPILDVFIQNIRDRMADIRLRDLETKGKS